MGNPVIYFFFFCSGFSGLIYQVVWVRVFGNVFGNTIYSMSLVVGVFMLGLGAGSCVIGAWSDRRYVAEPQSLLRAYGYFELVIGLIGLAVSALLPRLGQLSALVSSYSRDAAGWYALSTTSHVARAAIAIVLLTPITLLMGGTLTLLIRYLVRSDFETGGWRIAVLYAINTAGAALGCLLTDFALVPAFGLGRTQMVAVFFNGVAAVGGLYLAGSPTPRTRVHGTVAVPLGTAVPASASPTLALTSLALAMSGFAAMGMEILWFRHFTILLGAFRAVFSMLLTVILVGIGAGSLASGFLHRRTARPEQWLMVVQALFVASTLLGLAIADARFIEASVLADPAYRIAAGRGVEPEISRTFTELWFNARPILLEVGLPALLMGFSFPLGNAIIQRAEQPVGRRAGVLYLANTLGAVCGSVAAGFLLLPILGIQASATLLSITAGLAVAPLYLATRRERVQPKAGVKPEPKPNLKRSPKTDPAGAPGATAAWIAAMLISGAALGVWSLLPSDHVITRALASALEHDHLLTRREGLTEVITVTEAPSGGRTLLTNGHPMSSSTRLAQRYMRALAHIPLLCIDNPETVLVIGFGVGNTTRAATLHPSIRRVEVADLSRDILAHANYFREVNGDVLDDPRVIVNVNDGRHHLQMQPLTWYDLITLEPPPIAYAGVAALYSSDFYALARSRLKPKGYISQWLPVYQVSTTTTLAMIRAFIDVFPQAVLISGAAADLLLIGAKDAPIEIDPARLAAALSRSPAAQADLQRLDLGSVREIVGTFVGSAKQLLAATRETVPVSDDRPIQEYGARSPLDFGETVPASVVDLSQVATWCPGCFVGGKPIPLVDGLDTYLALLDLAYRASPVEMARARRRGDSGTRVIAGSAYLGEIVPESADLHNLLGIALADKGKLDGAITEFREALRLGPDSGKTHWHLGAALASHGAREEAVDHLRRSVQLDSGNGQARNDLGSLLLEARQLDDAVDQFRAALRLIPNLVEAHNNLGLALALRGKLDEAIEEFERVLTLDPEFGDARRNLAIARRQRAQTARRRYP